MGEWSIGNNLRFYSSGWGGNQYVSTTKLGSLAKFAGVATLGLGTALDYYSYLDGDISGFHFSTNLGVGLYGLAGGPFTAAPAIGYFFLDNFYPGGIAGALTEYGNISNRMLQYDLSWSVKY